MGVKRPLEVEFEEASFKQAKQLVSDDKRTTFIGPFASRDVSQPNGGKGRRIYLNKCVKLLCESEIAYLTDNSAEVLVCICNYIQR